MFYDGDDDEVKVNGQYKWDILLSQQNVRCYKNFALTLCLSIQQRIGHTGAARNSVALFSYTAPIYNLKFEVPLIT